MVYMKHLTIVACALLALCSCSGGGGSNDPEPTPTPTPKPTPTPSEKLPINISTTVASRATDNAFEEGDIIGVYIVNHNADGSAANLQTSGNYVDNSKYTYTNGKWTPASQTYWKDNTTHADFYLYYPYATSVGNVEAMPWSVKADQSQIAAYKAGDLLIGKTTDVAPSETAVKIDAKHVMSQMVIKLVAGNGFTDASLKAANISVLINRLKTNTSINLSTSIATATGDELNITPLKDGDNTYKAIIVPQTVGEGNLITVNVDGRDYNLPKDAKITAFEAGKKYQFTVTLSKTSNGVNVNIAKWEDDGIDYGGTAE